MSRVGRAQSLPRSATTPPIATVNGKLDVVTRAMNPTPSGTGTGTNAGPTKTNFFGKPVEGGASQGSSSKGGSTGAQPKGRVASDAGAVKGTRAPTTATPAGSRLPPIGPPGLEIAPGGGAPGGGTEPVRSLARAPSMTRSFSIKKAPLGAAGIGGSRKDLGPGVGGKTVVQGGRMGLAATAGQGSGGASSQAAAPSFTSLPATHTLLLASRGSGAATGAMTMSLPMALDSAERALPEDAGPMPPLETLQAMNASCGLVGLLAPLAGEDRGELLRHMRLVSFDPGEVVMRAGDPPANLYVVEAGDVILTRELNAPPSPTAEWHPWPGAGGDSAGDDDTSAVSVGAPRGRNGGRDAPRTTVIDDETVEIIRRVGPGESFGELALLHGGVRSCSAITGSDPVRCWALGRAAFARLLRGVTLERREKRLAVLSRFALIAAASPYGRVLAADAAVERTFDKGDKLTVEAAKGDATAASAPRVLYLLLDGEVSVTVGDHKTLERRLGPGDSLGEVGLVEGCGPTATCTAVTPVRAWVLDERAWGRLVAGTGGALDDAVAKSLATYKYPKWWLDSHRHVVPGEAGGKHSKGASSTKGAGTKSGKGLGASIGDLKAMGGGDGGGGAKNRSGASGSGAVGERTGTRGNNAAAAADDAGGEGDMGASSGTLEDPPKAVLSFYDEHRSVPRPWKKFKSVVTSLVELEMSRELGRGMIGRVHLCRIRRTQQLCALKILNKKAILAQNLVEPTYTEKNILTHITSPFLVPLLATFQDETNVYMLLDYMPGGDLFKGDLGPFSRDKESVRFYVGEIVLGLEYLHANNIIYRDLKLENVLIDGAGHAKLSDMGFAKLMPKGERTFTMCGTPDYYCPEMLRKEGYTHAADWWAFGVLLYEMLHGRTPFFSKDVDVMYYKIKESQLEYPEGADPDARDLINKLLDRDSAARYGALRGADDIKGHAFFRGFDWSAAAQRRLKPPLLPKPADKFKTEHLPAPEKKESANPNAPHVKERAMDDEEKALFAEF